MPFGSADRATLGEIARQVKNIGESVAALKQQVSDQQHVIDQIRRDATGAISSGLADIRSVARDAMTRTTDLITGPLTHINNEIVATHGMIGRLEADVRAVVSQSVDATDPTSQPSELAGRSGPYPRPDSHDEPTVRPSHDEADSESSGPQPDHATLRAAAGIAHATLEAHRDTWAFLIQTAGREQHFHIPGKVDDHDGYVSVRFSGPSLVAAITSLGELARSASNPVTQAIADHLQRKIVAAVREITDRPCHDSDGKPVRIVIDDRAAPDHTDTSPDTA
ncbi:hypothetical protein [Streptomyces sp. M92]|uniref:hypothetical protein n=1 Tax=Streptomyces sp. M92 TaxID=2944250 RepID=UPI00234A971F|nr:hypothetical protein [Streptomyces sp. M92]WCN05196.1 hypothetical protein M6G08_25540 [Streptomyces sp. M92]